MTTEDKVRIGTHSRWVCVKEWETIGNEKKTYLGIGEGGETSAWESLTQWEVFQVIQKLAEVSGLFTDRTGAMGLIIRRPENPREAERLEELADVFSGGEYDFKDLPNSTKMALSYILSGEIQRGEL